MPLVFTKTIYIVIKNLTEVTSHLSLIIMYVYEFALNFRYMYFFLLFQNLYTHLSLFFYVLHTTKRNNDAESTKYR